MTRQRMSPQDWNEPHWSQKRSRMNQSWCTAGEVRKQNGDGSMAGKWNGRGNAKKEQVTLYSMCTSEDEKDVWEANTETPLLITTEQHVQEAFCHRHSKVKQAATLRFKKTSKARER